VRNFFTVGAALSLYPVKQRLRPANQDGRKPALVRRWENLNAHGDPVGGALQGRPFQVDVEFLDLGNMGCGWLDFKCAHGSYFVAGNVRVNKDIFATFIDQA
jgi:metacaspase-1